MFTLCKILGALIQIILIVSVLWFFYIFATKGMPNMEDRLEQAEHIRE